MKRNIECKKLISMLLLATVTMLFSYLTYIFYWTSDSCFFALQFNYDDSDPSLPVRNIGDLVKSMSAHYMTWSGRFFCQSTVTVICSFMGRTGFVICNTIVWLVYLSVGAKLSGIRLEDTYKISCFTIISYLIFLTLPLDPSFLVNYLWMSSVVLVWLYLFVTVKSDVWWKCILMFVMGLLAGNAQESFSLPLGGALFIILIFYGFKDKRSLTEWSGICGFAIGLIILIASPGNYARLEASEGFSIIGEIRNAWASIGCLVLIMLLWLSAKKSRHAVNAGIKHLSGENIILILAVLVDILFIVVLRGNSLARTLIPVNVFLLILILNKNKEFRFKWIFALLMVVSMSVATIDENKIFRVNRVKYKEIENKYHLSQSGVVYIADSLFFHNSGRNCYYNKGWEIRERAVTPGKPNLKIYPEMLKGRYIARDTNMFIQVGPQNWIVAQSVKSPKPVMVKRMLSVGGFECRIPARELYVRDFERNIIDTVNNTVVGYYVNHKPYMRSELSW